ncbi:CPD photolyase [Nothobranchius furzeri]|uniref:Deoxyribodipyrimidine photo-lyase n=2 Tax=Nothobranchius furzeri TaxID=105023 RepID=A0A1A8AYG8_NOTFU|nr:CPD photolyase isoform X1 [Nothobranchius furzeri]KAF7223229.1 deoxyribodipyrimidine photo-lyase-like [Nothobranchius furzeri]
MHLKLQLNRKRLACFRTSFLFTFLAARSSFEATMSDRKRRAASSSSGKRPKLPSAPDREEGKEPAGWLLRAVQQQREDAKDQSFNRKRLRFISETEKVTQGSEGILYWMLRDQRVQDNWALIHAQQLAAQENLPLHVCFCLVVPKSPLSTLRHYSFLLKGLEEVAKECKQLNIQFHLLHGAAGDLLPAFVSDRDFGAVVTDFSPLREHLQLLKDVQKKLKKDVPLMQVDAHNVVPCWEASPKLEYAARTIRGKITSRLPEFLTDFPAVEKHPHTAVRTAKPVDWDEALASLDVDRSVEEPQWAKPGTAAGMAMLESFIDVRLKLFNTHRNDPNAAALSQLSPWIRFGHLSAQRVALQVRRCGKNATESVASFIEELVVRRELTDNFCFYNENYDSVKGAYEWAQKTLNDHAKDKREYLYTREQLEQAQTHDKLWNAAQYQMVRDGKMHGFMRMYWAKKILEWTSSPEEALSIALYLNDRYELDGQDPNGFVGCMWSICGIHDQGWSERPVFGKIRYMNYKGCLRKFDVAQFERKFCPKKP